MHQMIIIIVIIVIITIIIMIMMQALRDAASTRSGVGGVNVSQGHSGLGSYPRWTIIPSPYPVLIIWSYDDKMK